jgi:hypothetical protein
MPRIIAEKTSGTFIVSATTLLADILIRTISAINNISTALIE